MAAVVAQAGRPAVVVGAGRGAADGGGKEIHMLNKVLAFILAGAGALFAQTGWLRCREERARLRLGR